MPRLAKLNKAARKAAIRAALNVLASFGVTPDAPRFPSYDKDREETGEFMLMTRAGLYEGKIRAGRILVIHCRFYRDQDAFRDIYGRPIYKDNDYSSGTMDSALATLEAFRERLAKYGARAMTEGEIAALKAERAESARQWHADMEAAGLLPRAA